VRSSARSLSLVRQAPLTFSWNSNEDRVKFAVDEGFAAAGHALPRAPRPETPAAGLEAAKETAATILASYGVPETDGFDVVLECTGVETCMQAAIHVYRVLPCFAEELRLIYIFLSARSFLRRLLAPEEKLFSSEWERPMLFCAPSPSPVRSDPNSQPSLPTSPVSAAAFREVDLLGVFRYAYASALLSSPLQ
jgi:hypothetical protein